MQKIMVIAGSLTYHSGNQYTFFFSLIRENEHLIDEKLPLIDIAAKTQSIPNRRIAYFIYYLHTASRVKSL